MTAGNQFRPGPRPVFVSPEFLAQARELVETKNTLTEEQKKAATFCSRLWGGIHWRADNETGLAVGEKVGALVVERATTDGGGMG